MTVLERRCTPRLVVVSPQGTVGFLPVSATLRFDSRDPYSVGIVFSLLSPSRKVTWEFSRELLVEALLVGAAGEGDVRFSPHPIWDDQLWVTLTSPTGTAQFEIDTAELGDLIADAEQLVPFGTEPDRIDWERELAVLGWS